MKTKLIVLGIAALGFAGCQQFKKGEGDTLYKIHTDKDGTNIKEGDFIAFMAIQKTEGDSVLYNSYDFDRPALMLEQKPAFKGDLYGSLALLSEGDSATFKINVDSMEKKMGQPKPKGYKGKYMVFNLKINKVIPKGTMNDSVFHGVIDKYLKGEAELAKTSEAGKINNYIQAKSLKPEATASGLKYVITKQGSGQKANPGDTVQVNYTGMFVTGSNKVFDTSYPDVAKKSGTYNPMRPYAPIKVAVGGMGSIAGFDEALRMLPKGSKATVILPSNLAYGEQGNQAIPPFTPLIFDLEIMNIIPGKAMASTPPPAPMAPVVKAK